MGRIRNKIAIRNIALTIKEIRKEKGMTQDDFLYDDGIHIGRIEMGITDISCSTLISICDKFGITPAEFFMKMKK